MIETKNKKLKQRLKRLEKLIKYERNKTVSIWSKGTMSYEKAFQNFDKRISRLERDKPTDKK